MSRPFAPLPTVLGATFTAAEARAAGVGSRRLQAPDVERVLRGVYRRVVAGHDATSTRHSAEKWRLDQVARARAVAPALGPEQYFSHRTAAALLGLPVPMPTDRSDALDVAGPPNHSRCRRDGVRAHRVTQRGLHLWRIGGVRVAPPAEVWAMLGAELNLSDLVALGDAAIRRPRIPGTQRLERRPLSTRTELVQAIERSARPGNSRLRAAIPLLVTKSASAPESHLRLRLQEWHLPITALDHDVYDLDHVLLGASEIACPEFKVAWEYEGDHHRVETRQWNRDIEKYAAYEAAGWRAIRVTAHLLYVRPRDLRARSEAALFDRGWKPRPVN